MKFLRVLLPVIVLGVIALTPHAAYAASGATFFGPIVPPECHCDGDNSAPDFGCVLQTLENMMNFAVSMGVIIFVIIASYAGFLFMFSSINSHNKEMARQVLTNAVVGLLIALSAWLMVDFIMKALYNGKWGPWNSLLTDADAKQCLTVTAAPTAPGGGTTSAGTGGGVTGTTGTGGGTSSTTSTGTGSADQNEQAVRNQLAAAGIGVNKAACPTSAGNSCGGTPPSCTNVRGLQSATISKIISLTHQAGVSGSCDGGNSCSVVITGGSEPGHACGTLSHGNGYKIDVRTGSVLDTLLQGFHSEGTRNGDGPGPAYSDCSSYNAQTSTQYVRESDHWDIRINGC